MLCQGIDGLTSRSKAQEILPFPFQLSAEERELAAVCLSLCLLLGPQSVPGLLWHPWGVTVCWESWPVLGSCRADLGNELIPSSPLALAPGCIKHPSGSPEAGGAPR